MPKDGGTSLALMSRASQMLAEATTIQKAKELKDLALTAKDWAERKKLGNEVISNANFYALMAERKLGELLEATERNKGTAGKGRPKKGGDHSEPPKDDAPTLSDLGISKKESSKAQEVAALPDEEFQAVLSGKKTRKAATKEAKKKKAATKMKAAQEKVSEAARAKLEQVCDVRHCSMQELLASGIKPDCIVTDPPYPEKFLPVYGELAELCKKVPVVAVMCGQTYLPQIISAMAQHLDYRWTMAYLTPGGQSPQIFPRKVNTFWKPVLLFGKASEWIGDVCRSDTNDNDKRFHGWGQSESGMADLILKVTKPDDLVCDPFAGGGTTAVVCLRLGRRFVGCDIDRKAVEQTIQRCELAING